MQTHIHVLKHEHTDSSTYTNIIKTQTNQKLRTKITIKADSCACNYPGRNEDILKTHLCLSIWLSDCLNNRPQRNGPFPRNLTLGEGKGSGQRGTCLLKAIAQASNNLSDYFIDEAQAVMGQYGQDHLDWGCLYLNFNLDSRPQKDLGDSLDAVVLLPNVVMLNASPFPPFHFNLALLIVYWG